MAKQKTSAADFLPDGRSLADLSAASQSCRGCELYKLWTQTVFGEGPKMAEVMLVGEQLDAVVERSHRREQIVAEPRAEQARKFMRFHAAPPEDR
jgi:hypothetical protein